MSPRSTDSIAALVSTLGRLRVARLRFRAIARDAIVFGDFPGSAVRGGFLAGLFDVGCVMPKRDCPRCELRADCPVTRVSGEDREPSPTRTALYRIDVSRLPPRLLAGEEFEFGLDLYGDAAESKRLARAAIKRFAERGVGRRRARFDLLDVEGDPIFASPTLEADLASRVAETRKRAASSAEICFLTPLRVVLDGRTLQSFSFDPFVRSLVRRARLLLESSERIDLGLAERDLVTDAKSVRVIESRLAKQDQVRFSSRQGRSMNLHGIQGAVVIEGDLARFAPWLAFGSLVGVGKGATFGQGAFEIRAVDARIVEASGATMLPPGAAPR